MTDMTERVFENQPFGNIAMQKIGDVDCNFRLFSASWLGNDPRKSLLMKITGATFRRAKSGSNKGVLSIKVPDTTKTVYVTKAEIEVCLKSLHHNIR